MESFSEPSSASQFTATKWHSVADKEKFVRYYIRFVEARCPVDKFHNWFYSRLMQMFFHIAHFNRAGFHQTWCDTSEKRLALLRRHIEYECVGDPAWTWSDVERVLQAWIRESGILREYEFEAQLTQRETTLAAARTVLSELTYDDFQRLLRERSSRLGTGADHRSEVDLDSTLPVGKQKALFWW